MSNESKGTIAVGCQELGNVLEVNKVALKNLNGLLSKDQKKRLGSNSVQQSLRVVRTNLINAQLAIASLVGADGLAETFAKPQVAAQQVFDVPELLEQILVNLEPLELLSVAKVCQETAAAVRTSPRLQRILCTKGDEKSFFHLPLQRWTTPCFRSTLAHAKTNIKKGTVQVEATFSTHRALPDIGPRGRSVLLSQPPVKTASVKISCCSGSDLGPLLYNWQDLPRPSRPAKVTNETGITIGDLLDCTRKLRREHRHCPYTPPHLLDGNGCVVPQVEFVAKICLSPQDPVFDDARRRQSHEDEKQARQNMLERYVKAKRDAFLAGGPIPTLAEFTAGETATQ